MDPTADAPRKPSDKQLIETAKRLYHDEGTVEIDDDAEVSRSSEADDRDAPHDRGAYVKAWVWVTYDDVRR